MITEAQQTILEIALMDYLLDLDDFLKGKITLNVMNVRRPKEAIIKMLQADLDDYLSDSPRAVDEEFAQNLKQAIVLLQELPEEDYTQFKNQLLELEPVSLE